jgi:hypothetical protein
MILRIAFLRIVVAITLLGITNAASAEVVLSNLQPPPGVGSGIGIGLLSPPATTNTIRGQEFFTGATAPGYRLNSVTLHLAGAAGTPGDFVLELYEGPVSGVAVGPIGEFTVSSNPVAAGHHTFNFADDLILGPGTRYMIVASAPDVAGNTVSRYGWHLGNFQGSPAGAWGINGQWVSSIGAASWAPVRSGPFQFAIDATAVPEPASVALAAIGFTLLAIVRRRKHRRQSRRH